MLHFDIVLSVYLVFPFQDIEVNSYLGNFIKTHLNPIPLITFDHLRESFVLTFHISYIEDDACSNFRGCPFVLKFPSFIFF